MKADGAVRVVGPVRVILAKEMDEAIEADKVEEVVKGKQLKDNNRQTDKQTALYTGAYCMQ